MLRKVFPFFIVFIGGTDIYAQTYSPLSVTGFNSDVFAEALSSLSTTSISMDLSNNVMYTQSFATSAGIAGGIVNNGTVVSGVRTYQLASFNSSNCLHVVQGSSLNLTVSAPASFSKISLMALSTESATTVNITLGFTDGSTTNYGNFNLDDWFYGSINVYCCFGRVNRLSTGPYTVSGLPTNPKFFPIDLTLSCTDQIKNLETVTISTVSGVTNFSSAFVFAVSGVPYSENVIPVITDVSCNGSLDGSAILNVTGSNSPYSFSWNTFPVQTTAIALDLSAGNYICTITDANGCVTYDTVIISEPPPAVANVVANPSSICSGSNTQLSVTGLFVFTWNPGGQNISPINVSPSATTTYTVSGTDANGCNATGTVTVTVNANPTITISPNPVTICNGTSVSLQASGGQTYSWSPATGLSSTSVSNPNANPAASTTYTVTGTDANGCVNTATVDVNVNSIPVITVIPNPATICYGSSVILQAGGAQNYSWSPSTGLSTSSSSNPSASPASSTTYTVTGIDFNGCSGIATVIVNVNPLPVVNAVATPSIICQGNSTQLTVGGLTSFTWSPGGQTVSPLTVSPLTSTTYTVSGTDAAGCSGTATIDVTVNPAPVITVVASDTLVCSEMVVTLTASGGATNYTWNPGGLNGSSIEVNPATTTTYFVTGDFNGCAALNSITIQVAPLAQALFTASPVAGCEPLTVVFNNQSLNVTNYEWWFSDGSATSVQNPSHTFPTGSWDVSLAVTNILGCPDTLSQQEYINVYPNPEALFSVDPPMNTPVDLSSAIFQFTNESTGGEIYEWNFGDNSFDNTINPSHTYTTSGNYTVQLFVTSTDGCTDSVSLGFIQILASNSAYFPDAFTPNGDGLNDFFQLVITPNVKAVTLQVFNRWGQMLYHSNDINQGWDGRYMDQMQAVGVFVYSAAITFNNGMVRQLKGNVTLIR